MCVHGSSEAMGKISKTVAVVASVANGSLLFPMFSVSRVGIITTSTLPCPFPVKTLTSVYVV